MPDNNLGLKQRAVLFVLMFEARELSNPEMDELHKLRLTGQELTDVLDLGYVVSRKVKRGAWAHELTDKGWRWCADELVADRPPRVDSLGKAFYGFLGKFARYLDRAELGLADVFAPAEPSLEDRIRSAYRTLAADPGDWVSLTDLRRALNGDPRTEVDAALLGLNDDPEVHIAPEDDQESMTQQDREAALRIGGQDNHLLSIGST
jgi:hypothetical protein